MHLHYDTCTECPVLTLCYITCITMLLLQYNVCITCTYNVVLLGIVVSYCIIPQTIEGLRAKRAYIGFWLIFIFCRIELIFDRLTCFDMKSIIPYLFWSICALFSRNSVRKNSVLGEVAS